MTRVHSQMDRQYGRGKGPAKSEGSVKVKGHRVGERTSPERGIKLPTTHVFVIPLSIPLQQMQSISRP